MLFKGVLRALIYVNDLHNIVKFCKLHQYCDDTTLVAVIRGKDDLARVEEDISNIFKWSKPMNLK